MNNNKNFLSYFTFPGSFNCIINLNLIEFCNLSTVIRRLGVKSWQLFFFDKTDRSQRNMEIYKWKWMVLGALGCMNNADY